MKRLVFLIFTLVGLTGWVMTAKSASDKPKRGGTLTMAVRKDITLMNPLVTTRSTDRSIRELMFESLLGVDLKGNIQPYLAESWNISKDGKTYTFNLRKGVKFHDGREMTAADAKFSIDYTMNPKNGAYGFSNLSAVDKVETVDRYTLKITVKKINPPFISYLTEITSFSVIPKDSLKEGINKPTNYPPGTGPFKFGSWKPKQRMVFERYDDYWGHKAFVDKVVLRPVRNSTIRFTALRSGDVDMVERTPYEWVKQLVDGKIKGINFVKAPYAGFRRLIFNVASRHFSNRKLRQAVAHAIDRKEILEAAYLGFGDPTDQKFPHGHAWYMDDVHVPKFDLAKAKSLLREAGYKGQAIPLMVRQGEDQETEATVLQAQLKKIGMKIKVELMDYGAYSSRLRKGEFSFMFYGGGYDQDPTLAYTADLLCGNPKKRASNVAGYCDKGMDAMLKKAEVEIDPKKRRALFKQILTKLNDDLPFVPVGYVPRFFTFRDDVKGFLTDSRGGFRPWGSGLNYTWQEKTKP